MPAGGAANRIRKIVCGKIRQREQRQGDEGIFAGDAYLFTPNKTAKMRPRPL
jgi:hypothetical protein